MNEQALREQLTDLHAANKALLIVTMALIRTHPRYEEFQLMLTSLLEQQLAPSSPMGSTMNEEEREITRAVVELLQTLPPSLTDASPASAFKPPLPPKRL